VKEKKNRLLIFVLLALDFKIHSLHNKCTGIYSCAEAKLNSILHCLMGYKCAETLAGIEFIRK
jgi:hypothetical protein